ncbi:unnamed protein product [Symbiodinium necroappetens]|uniref:ATP-dependent RNA helicase DDX60 PIN-like domain-containing protein n=1 Tax=Symbiodinium necroappetens TaxID=1628268 RepID=A0A812L8Y4_9DINO|nr:unnamed protein product [Symbiodinium necroappetens]
MRLSAEVNEDGQFLRMTFMVEQLLSSIKSCGGVYRIIFFDAFKHVFSMQFEDSLWAFREAFLSHCRSHGIDHEVFPHWYSPEWKEHVSTWRPSLFLLADDGLAVEEDEEASLVRKESFFFSEIFGRSARKTRKKPSRMQS